MKIKQFPGSHLPSHHLENYSTAISVSTYQFGFPFSSQAELCVYIRCGRSFIARSNSSLAAHCSCVSCRCHHSSAAKHYKGRKPLTGFLPCLDVFRAEYQPPSVQSTVLNTCRCCPSCERSSNPLLTAQRKPPPVLRITLL